MMRWKNMLLTGFLIMAASVALPALSADDRAKIDMEELRQQTSEDKELIVAVNMGLTESEAKVFWPIYDAYQDDLHKINIRLVKVINDYALAYNKGAVMNDTAEKLINEAIAIELDEAKLKQTYAPRFGKVLPAAKVARYFQIENKIRAVVRYVLAEGVPLVR